MPTLDQGWAALLGALVGGGASFAATWFTLRKQDAAAKQRQADLDAATALLIQDDFLHYQATLAYALDTGNWWDQARLLKQQATVKDRKRVWAALTDEEKTKVVAGAQGWMDVLIQRRLTLGHPHKLEPGDVVRICKTFCALEHGRKELGDLARRPYESFEHSGVLEDLTTCKTMPALLGSYVDELPPAP